jgi:Na+-translocating ferredoxin:NAD+ oxidoreductase RnfC subunit
LQTILKKIKDYGIPLQVYEVILYTNMYLSRYVTDSMFHSYDTRNKLDLFITGHNTKLFEQSITYSSVLIYNKLSHEIKGVKCIMKLKKIHFT